MTNRDRQYILHSPCQICRAKNCRKLYCPLFTEWFQKAWEATTGLFRVRTDELNDETKCADCKREDGPLAQGVLHNSNT